MGRNSYIMIRGALKGEADERGSTVLTKEKEKKVALLEMKLNI